MPPESFLDDDPPPRNSPHLMGDRLTHLKSYRKTMELRRPSPVSASSHQFHRNLIVVLAVKAGLRHEVVADALGLSRARVTNIVREMERLLPPASEAD